MLLVWAICPSPRIADATPQPIPPGLSICRRLNNVVMPLGMHPNGALIARSPGYLVTTVMSVSQMVTGQDWVQPTLFAMQVALAGYTGVRPVVPGEIFTTPPLKLSVKI